MERNPNDTLSGGSAGGTGAGAGSALGAGTDSISVTGTGAGQSASTGGYGDSESRLADVNVGGGPGAAPPADRASDRMHQAREMASERLGQVKEKASQLSATLADRLEAGANQLRERSNRAAAGTPQLAGAEGSTTSTAQGNEQVQRLSGTAADAMQKTADFLRTGDMKGTIEEQVRTNPGRTLLVALGVGYVLGKALRRR